MVGRWVFLAQNDRYAVGQIVEEVGDYYLTRVPDEDTGLSGLRLLGVDNFDVDTGTVLFDTEEELRHHVACVTTPTEGAPRVVPLKRET